MRNRSNIIIDYKIYLFTMTINNLKGFYLYFELVC